MRTLRARCPRHNTDANGIDAALVTVIIKAIVCRNRVRVHYVFTFTQLFCYTVPPQPGNLSPQILTDLLKLYKLKSEVAKKMVVKERTEEEVKKITEDLSNVDLD